VSGKYGEIWLADADGKDSLKLWREKFAKLMDAAKES
jgi:hypothetical protein